MKKQEMQATKLSKEMIDNIKHYSENIKTLDEFVDSVRKNPGQYISAIGDEGFMNCIREIFQNATDEMDRSYSPCNKVWVEYFENDFRTIVTDNGRGLPPEDIVRIYTKDHTSSNYDKKAGSGNYSSGTHGSGSKAVNAVSSLFKVTTYRLGRAWQIEFSEGRPIKKYATGNKKVPYAPKEIPNKNNLQGTVVEFTPDFKILKSINIRAMDVYTMIKDLFPLYNINDQIEFTGHTIDGKIIHDDMINKDGIFTFLIRKTDKPLIAPIRFGIDNGTMKADVAITWTPDMNRSADVETFANCTKVDTERSMPSRGFFKGLCDFFRNYMNKIFLANSRRKLEVTNGDCLTGLVGAISSAHIHPIFDSQAKNVCKNDDLFDFLRDLTKRSLQNWAKQKPEDLQKICGFLKDVATARTNADKEKVNISKKYKTDSLTKTPKGFIKAENKDHLELFIVEGLSAASPCQTSRDTRYQAIFPIRGKMPNAFSKSKQEMLKNEEVQAILGILGCGYGKDFDIKKCKYDKIIILSDGDYDGFHIRTLVLIFLLTYCRPLIEEGRVYAVLSPLYHINRKTKKWQYFIDKDDFLVYVRNQFCKNNTVAHAKNKKVFTHKELDKLIDDFGDYDLLMDTISSNLSIYPVLLEDILILQYNAKYSKFSIFKNKIESKYKYLKVEKRNGQVVVDGLAYNLAHTIVISQQFLDFCRPLYAPLEKSEKRYLLNGSKVGLYELIRTYRQSEPSNIERAKGLGTLNDVEIGISTLSPENRKMLRYTAQDINKEIEEMRKVNDKKFTLIEGVDISTFEF